VFAVAVATAGAVLVIAANLNSLIIDTAGIRVGTITVGFVEEGTKLLIPLILFLLGRYRDLRAGIAIGLAAGFGFAVAETTQYAYATANASGPDFCGNSTGTPTVADVVQAQAYRMFTVSPLHWLWTGIAVAIAWRLWHLYGRRGTPGAVAAIVLVMVIHSANDTSATLGCDSTAVSLLAQLFRWVLLVAVYLVFKAVARKSTPPQLIGAVSKGWVPKHLPSQ
jgi:RsiW-degrading membrane proteinase PrsW (M82 family)